MWMMMEVKLCCVAACEIWSKLYCWSVWKENGTICGHVCPQVHICFSFFASFKELRCLRTWQRWIKIVIAYFKIIFEGSLTMAKLEWLEIAALCLRRIWVKILLDEQRGCFLVVFFGIEALFAARTSVALLNVSETACFVEEDSFLA